MSTTATISTGNDQTTSSNNHSMVTMLQNYQGTRMELEYAQYLIRTVFLQQQQQQQQLVDDPNNIHISGKYLVPFLSKSNLDRAILRTIWDVVIAATATTTGVVGYISSLHQFVLLLRCIAIIQYQQQQQQEKEQNQPLFSSSVLTITTATALQEYFQQTIHNTNIPLAQFTGTPIPSFILQIQQQQQQQQVSKGNYGSSSNGISPMIIMDGASASIPTRTTAVVDDDPADPFRGIGVATNTITATTLTSMATTTTTTSATAVNTYQNDDDDDDQFGDFTSMTTTNNNSTGTDETFIPPTTAVTTTLVQQQQQQVEQQQHLSSTLQQFQSQQPQHLFNNTAALSNIINNNNNNNNNDNNTAMTNDDDDPFRAFDALDTHIPISTPPSLLVPPLMSSATTSTISSTPLVESLSFTLASTIPHSSSIAITPATSATTIDPISVIQQQQQQPSSSSLSVLKNHAVGINGNISNIADHNHKVMSYPILEQQLQPQTDVAVVQLKQQQEESESEQFGDFIDGGTTTTAVHDETSLPQQQHPVVLNDNNNKFDAFDALLELNTTTPDAPLLAPLPSFSSFVAGPDHDTAAATNHITTANTTTSSDELAAAPAPNNVDDKNIDEESDDFDDFVTSNVVVDEIRNMATANEVATIVGNNTNHPKTSTATSGGDGEISGWEALDALAVTIPTMTSIPASDVTNDLSPITRTEKNDASQVSNNNDDNVRIVTEEPAENISGSTGGWDALDALVSSTLADPTLPSIIGHSTINTASDFDAFESCQAYKPENVDNSDSEGFGTFISSDITDTVDIDSKNKNLAPPTDVSAGINVDREMEGIDTPSNITDSDKINETDVVNAPANIIEIDTRTDTAQPNEWSVDSVVGLVNGTTVEHNITSGWNVFDAISETTDAPLPSLVELSHETISPNILEAKTDLEQIPIEAVDEDISDGFGDFVGGTDEAPLQVATEDVILQDLPPTPTLVYDDPFSVLSTSEQVPIPSSHIPYDRADSTYYSAQAISVTSDSQDWNNFEDATMNGSEVDDIDKDAIQVDTINMDLYNDATNVIPNGDVVENYDPFAAFSAVATTQPDIDHDPTLNTDGMVANEANTEDIEDFSDFHDVSNERLEQHNINDPVPTTDEGSIKASYSGEANDIAPSSLPNGIDDDDFGDFETTQFPDTIDNNTLSNQDTINVDEGFGNFDDFIPAESSMVPAATSIPPSSKATEVLLSDNRVMLPGFTVETDDDWVWVQHHIVLKSQALPDTLRNTLGSSMDFGSSFANNMGRKVPLSESRMHQIFRCVNLIDRLSTSDGKELSATWVDVLSLIKKELLNAMAILQDSVDLDTNDLLYVRKHVKLYVQGLKEYVRVSRCIIATIADLLMLDVFTMLSDETLSSSFLSCSLAIEGHEIELLWDKVLIFDEKLDLGVVDDNSMNRLEDIVEIRSRLFDSSIDAALCGFTLQPLPNPIKIKSTQNVLSILGHRYMACAANLLYHRTMFFDDSKNRLEI